MGWILRLAVYILTCAILCVWKNTNVLGNFNAYVTVNYNADNVEYI